MPEKHQPPDHGATMNKDATPEPGPGSGDPADITASGTSGSGQDRGSVSFLIFSASLRSEALNTQLANLAMQTIETQGGKVDLASMQDFDVPSYDADVEHSDGLPPGAEELRRRLQASDAFVIASPEYNASMPGLLKNAIDWVSRSQPQPFHERHGRISNPQLQERFDATIAGFIDLVEAAKHYPCVKTKWVEFLGERPDPAVDRVE
jgi:hypothetical protein